MTGANNARFRRDDRIYRDVPVQLGNGSAASAVLDFAERQLLAKSRCAGETSATTAVWGKRKIGPALITLS